LYSVFTSTTSCDPDFSFTLNGVVPFACPSTLTVHHGLVAMTNVPSPLGVFVGVGVGVGVLVGVGVGAYRVKQLLPRSPDKSSMFNFSRLDVYRCAIEFFKLAVPLTDRAPTGYHSLNDQLRRAAVSIPLNIAEGSGKYGSDERRYFLIARGSALECAAIVDVFEALTVISAEEALRVRTVLERIVAMLTKLAMA